MNTLKVISIFAIIMLIMGCIETSPSTINVSKVINTSIVNETFNVTIVNKTIIDDPYPKPNYTPTLRDYKINKDNDIWKAQNPKSYIEPNNEWVKYYANQLYIDNDGFIRYINRSLNNWENPLFTNTYITDNEQFHYPPNDDYWINADYYLTHNMTGDCEDFAIALISMMQSGEIRNQDGMKITIPSKLVSGYIENHVRHTWIEYTFNGTTYISDSPGNVKNPIDGSVEFSITQYTNNTVEFNPVYYYN